MVGAGEQDFIVELVEVDDIGVLVGVELVGKDVLPVVVVVPILQYQAV